MLGLNEYKSIDEVMNYFTTVLPELNANRISSVIKYAKVQDQLIKLQAIKRKSGDGISWNFEVTVS